MSAAPIARQLHLDVGEIGPFDVAVDGRSLGEFVGPILTLPTREWADGPHQVTVTSTGLFGSKQVRFPITTDNNGPVIEIAKSSLQVAQGHTDAVFLRSSEEATLQLRFQDRDRPLYPVGERTYRALIGVPIRATPGPTPLEIRATDSLGNTTSITVNIEVQPVEWPTSGKLPLSKKKASVPSAAIVKMRGERDPIYAEDRDQALWEGPMQLPVVGIHTSAFGTFREYPDGRRSHHDAEDIAKKRGTPIYAAANGEVRLAHMQAVHGNAILLAHGQGVVSLYSHLKRIDVREGDTIHKGERLGEMGTTGRSTGPHLHWGVVVDEIPVDPMQWSHQGFGLNDLTEWVTPE